MHALLIKYQLNELLNTYKYRVYHVLKINENKIFWKIMYLYINYFHNKN